MSKPAATCSAPLRLHTDVMHFYVTLALNTRFFFLYGRRNLTHLLNCLLRNDELFDDHGPFLDHHLFLVNGNADGLTSLQLQDTDIIRRGRMILVRGINRRWVSARVTFDDYLFTVHWDLDCFFLCDDPFMNKNLTG